MNCIPFFRHMLYHLISWRIIITTPLLANDSQIEEKSISISKPSLEEAVPVCAVNYSTNIFE